ncbi:MAG: universal stress protein [Verrucomicrobia bacterium]|nr:universal stress protein [Verrucomicrobiota bacterium]
MNAPDLASSMPNPALTSAAPGPGIRRILVGVDAFASDQETVRHALRLAPSLEADIVLLHVALVPIDAAGQIEPIPSMLANTDAMLAREEAIRQRSLEQLAELEASVRLVYPRVEAHVLTGEPDTRLLDAVRIFECDLLIIATHGYTGFKRLFLGSTAEKVVRHATCPVLVVRRDGAAQKDEG